jgi:microcystin-dependent protein
MNQSVIDRATIVTTNSSGDFSARAMSDIAPPPGTVVMWWNASKSPPPGWAFCDGNGVPDMRGVFPLGWGNRGVNATGGVETVTLNINQIPGHSHSFSHYIGYNGGHCDEGNAISCAEQYQWDNGANRQTTSTGSGAAHENMPPYIVMKFIVKL